MRHSEISPNTQASSQTGCLGSQFGGEVVKSIPDSGNRDSRFLQGRQSITRKASYSKGRLHLQVAPLVVRLAWF